MIYVQLFEHFQMSEMEHMLDEKKVHSEMLVKLLTYLIVHRKKVSTIQELTDVFWDDDRSENPAGALKNLMYRLRTILKNAWGEGTYIITGRGSYQWNPEIEITLDTELFEQYCKGSQTLTDKKMKMEAEMKAVELYKGKLLPNIADEYWILNMSGYYHSMYLRVVNELLDELREAKQYVEMEECARKALNQDSLDENLHCAMLQALMGQGKQTEALDYFQHAEELLYDNLGVKPSEEMFAIYEELMKESHEEQQDITMIQRELSSLEPASGAFYCEYGIFKKHYELEARRAGRLGISVFLGLISLCVTPEIRKDPEVSKKAISVGMNQLQEVLQSSLRTGDAMTRYSHNQFLIMLQGCQYENAQLVMRRIETRFYATKRRAKVNMQYSLDEMTVK